MIGKAAVAVLGLALIGSPALATIVNISAYDPNSAGGVPQPTTVQFGPGTYTSTVIGTAQGGEYSAWGVAQPSAGNWDERYNISYNGTTTAVNPNNAQRYATPAAALASVAGLSTTFTLAALTNVTFSIPDYLWYDNAGGVSLSVLPATAVPEPGTIALFGAAVAAFLVMWQRRRNSVA